MAQDRFIVWGDTKPTLSEVGELLADYLGGFADELRLDRSRYTVLLVGKQSNPHRRVGPTVDGYNLGAIWDDGGERWIEVFVTEDNIDVITRHGDPATCALADGLTELAARRWQGRIERG